MLVQKNLGKKWVIKKLVKKIVVKKCWLKIIASKYFRSKKLLGRINPRGRTYDPPPHQKKRMIIICFVRWGRIQNFIPLEVSNLTLGWLVVRLGFWQLFWYFGYMILIKTRPGSKVISLKNFEPLMGLKRGLILGEVGDNWSPPHIK